MHVGGITHVALELSWPTRMEDYLRDAFGLQTLRHGYWKGEYIRVMGSPNPEIKNPGFIVLYLRTGIPEGRLRHVGFGVDDMKVSEAVQDLKGRGIYVDVDGGNMLYCPEDLRIKLDSFDESPWASEGENIKMEECPVDPDLPCMVEGIHHVALDLDVPTRMRDWMENAFGMDSKRSFHRRGEYIFGINYANKPKDTIGRRGGLFAVFQRPGLTRARLHHLAFNIENTEEAMQTLEERGFEVPVTDAIMFGPEGIWFQIDSNKTPFPIGHPTNQPGVLLVEDEWKKKS